jgi:GNAT superfamily N-acetyltransferase
VLEERKAGVNIHRWLDVPHRERLLAGLDRVFFESSGTTEFASEEARKVFRERWLGRYLVHYPEWAYVALDGEGSLVGYLVGSLDDPAQSALFGDIGYFLALAAWTRDFPAQIHVNLLPAWRGLGIGSRLIQTIVADLAGTDVPGVHVVTGRAMRNVRYYEANGFAEVAGIEWNGKELVMLGRRCHGVGPLA